MATQEPSNVNVNVISNQKSVLAAVLLTLFFGPLGMFYSTIIGGIVMLILSILVAIFTLGIGFLITWPVCIIWAVISTNKHNKKSI